MVRYRAHSAMAPIPFDRHGVPGTIELVDDFIAAGADVTVTSSAGVAFVSELDWNAVAMDATSGLLSIVVGESDHQGIIRFASVLPTSSTQALRLKLGRQVAQEADMPFILDTNGLYVAAVLRVPTLAATAVAFGLTGVALTGSGTETPNGSSLDEIAWVFDDEESAIGAVWIAQVNGAGTDVEKVSGITYVAGDWVLLEIAADTTGVTFRVTTEDDTETLNIDSSDSSVEPVVSLRPFFGLSPGADGTAGTYDIDSFALRYIRRQPLVASWLGQ